MLQTTLTTRAQDLPMPEMVQALIDQFKGIWWQCDSRLPELGNTYTWREQFTAERSMGRRLDAVLAQARRRPEGGAETQALQDQIAALATDFARTCAGLDDADIAAIRSYGFIDCVDEFSAMARRFDASISASDIYQASRNVWSMNIMQILLGRPVEMTPAIFAYSMLYPLSDNYLDDPAIPFETKRTFNVRFRRRLAGEEIVPANAHEQAISELIAQIEGQFDRAQFPQVYASLIEIHRAQTGSLALLGSNPSPYELDVLGICFDKGGTSVLADGYLVAGDLDAAQREFMFYYGTFTQLMDDLEDVQEDRRRNLMTVFSQTAGRWPLDAVTTRTIHFGNRVLDAVDRIAPPAAQPLQKIFRKCFTPLLLASAGQAAQFYTRAYRQEIESHLPYRFAFLNHQRRRLARQQVTLMHLVEALSQPEG